MCCVRKLIWFIQSCYVNIYLNKHLFSASGFCWWTATSSGQYVKKKSRFYYFDLKSLWCNCGNVLLVFDVNTPPPSPSPSGVHSSTLLSQHWAVQWQLLRNKTTLEKHPKLPQTETEKTARTQTRKRVDLFKCLWI